MAADLVAFLNSALDEDEREAKAAAPGPWRWDDPHFEDEPRPSTCGEWGHDGPDLIDKDGQHVITSSGYDADSVVVRRPDAVHIARWDPARVLAEVAAKRAILAKLDEYAPPWSDSRSQEIWETIAEEVVPILAQPFAGRAGFDPSWLD